MSIKDVYMVGAVRTPTGRFGGALAGIETREIQEHVRVARGKY